MALGLESFRRLAISVEDGQQISAVRLMLAGLIQGIVDDRKLMREAQVNLTIRWFASNRGDEKLRGHDNPARIHRQWYPERFKRIF